MDLLVFEMYCVEHVNIDFNQLNPLHCGQTIVCGLLLLDGSMKLIRKLQMDFTVDRYTNERYIQLRTKLFVLPLHVPIFCSQIYILDQQFKVLQVTLNMVSVCSIEL